MEPLNYGMEPFKIKMVEPIAITTKEQRAMALEESGFNPFRIASSHVTIDMLTDSGTGAMSADQWAAILNGDESYAGARSYFHFNQTASEILGYKHILPVHQGRAAERILYSLLVKPGDTVPNNTHFDTTRANVLRAGGDPMDLPASENGKIDPKFLGNMNIDKLQEVIANPALHVPMVVVTVTNNGGGGHPVSMKNIRDVSTICKKNDIPFFFDACRFAENAYFIQTREPEFQNHSIKEIVRMMFSLSDGCIISVKKDGLVNIGGILATNDTDLHNKFSEDLIATEGFISYGGLAGRDLDAIAVGLREGVNEDYLRYRIWSTAKLGEILKDNGVPVIEPVGGHAVYIDAREVCKHLPVSQYPAWSLNCALYLEGGIRGGEIGGVMLDDHKGGVVREMVRLAIPRRVYTISHFEYVGRVLKKIMESKDSISGFQIEKGEGPIRHFIAQMAPLRK